MTNPFARFRRSEWLAPGALIALGLVPSVAGVVRLVTLASGVVTEANARFFAAPIPVVLHIVVVLPFSLVGALQFARAFRRRSPRWHRRTGRILAPLGLIVAGTGLWMTLSYPWPPGDGQALYFQRLMFGSLMFASALLGLDAIRRRDFREHGAWMTRAYAIAMGAGTQVLTHLPWFVLFGQPTQGDRAVLMGAGWVTNLLVAEWVIWRRRVDQARPPVGALATSVV